MKIQFVITGGTIDSSWFPAKDTTIVNSESGIEKYINKFISPKIEISYKTISMKDSRDINDDIRCEILNFIKNSYDKNFIITHGTYTMVETGMFLKKHEKELSDKVIVLVGSFWPLEGFSLNDAGFNLGYAVGVLNNLNSGIYVAMHATLFNIENVEKDILNANFVNKDS